MVEKCMWQISFMQHISQWTNSEIFLFCTSTTLKRHKLVTQVLKGAFMTVTLITLLEVTQNFKGVFMAIVTY